MKRTMRRLVGPFRRPGANRGYTLVELLVAVAIFSIAIAGVVAVLRKGIETTVTDAHRQQARSLIMSCLESADYQPDKYTTMAGGHRPVVIDARNPATTADDLTGTLTVTITDHTDLSSATPVPYKAVSVSVQWTEPEGAQNITLEKWVTQL